MFFYYIYELFIYLFIAAEIYELFIYLYTAAEIFALVFQGTPPTRINVRAEVDFTIGTGITSIRLFVSGEAPGLDSEAFRAAAEEAKVNCPMSQALKAVPIMLTMV